ncbi:MAG: adenine phosphoribosyltransferase [Spirochaetes bacterium GWF1_51_8]|nr:MAG: adenine phosphoribosyltransferase [Spirochaetes bacterium GWF1_51_8]
MDYKNIIRDVPDYPKPGILFKDITTLWKNPSAFKSSLDELAENYRKMNITKVIGAESRGFIVGAPVAYILGAGFVPVRKKGKLPAGTISESYALEYGEAALEIHQDAIEPGENILIVDDLLATGGTCEAMIRLIRNLGGNTLGAAFLVELEFLHGREKIDAPVFSLIKYE